MTTDIALHATPTAPPTSIEGVCLQTRTASCWRCRATYRWLATEAIGADCPDRAALARGYDGQKLPGKAGCPRCRCYPLGALISGLARDVVAAPVQGLVCGLAVEVPAKILAIVLGADWIQYAAGITVWAVTVFLLQEALASWLREPALTFCSLEEEAHAALVAEADARGVAPEVLWYRRIHGERALEGREPFVLARALDDAAPRPRFPCACDRGARR